MSATELPSTSVVEGTHARAGIVPPGVMSAPVAPTPAVPTRAAAVRDRKGRLGLSRTARQVLAITFAAAWLACPLIEPMPGEAEMHYPLWQLPIDLAAIGTIIVAVAALWRGSPRAPRFGIAAGGMMAVETIVCPYAGHTPIGWWTWVQAGLSLYVLFTSAALHTRRRV